MARRADQTRKTLFALLFAAILAAGCLAGPSEPHDAHPAHEAGEAHAGHEAPNATHDHPGHATHAAPDAGLDLLNPPELTHTPPFPLEDGTIPTLDQAKAFTKKYSRFIAKGDGGIQKLRAEGHLKGNGTPDAPYLLENFYVDGELSLTSLHKSIILRNGYVAGQLKLNYVGDSLYVHHVYAKDLRVNENIQRNGTNTGGLFHDNHFPFVGQIRHYTGEFRDNKIGPKPADAIGDSLGDSGIVKVPHEVVFNFDGFHGADVHHNDFLGQVDIKLHGHNHGDCFTCPAHNHADLQDTGHQAHTLPPNAHGFTSIHQVRYSSLLFRDNTITVPGGTALRYNDQNHAADDRTANSEPHERLNDPHIHHQDVTLRNNRLLGGQLLIDVFNAHDDRHPAQNQGALRLWDNQVTVDYQAPTLTQSAPSLITGIQVRRADGLGLHARANTIQFQEVRDDRPGSDLTRLGAPKVELRGYQLDTIDASNLTITQSTVATGRYGVWAQTLSDTTHWWLRSNEFRTEEAWRGKDVAHPPTEE